jgi:hypothetical protein
MYGGRARDVLGAGFVDGCDSSTGGKACVFIGFVRLLDGRRAANLQILLNDT